MDIDYELVINPLRKVHSLDDYDLYFLGKIFDVQPVRDIFFIFAIYLEKMLGHQVFGTMNLMFWIGSLMLFLKIAEHFSNRSTARLVGLLICLHPVLAWTIAWPTAMKHFISTFFIMLASWLTIQYREGKVRGFWVWLAYSLSILSQPISLLWPCVFVLYLWEDKKFKKHFPLLLLLFVTFGLTAYANSIYYSEIYPIFSGAIKSSENHPFAFSIKVISFSRSLSQLLLPIHFASDYSPSSVLGYIGLPLTIVLFSIARIRLSAKTVTLGLAFILSPLILINSKTTNIFVSDTYLLIPLCGLGLILTLFLSRVTGRFLKYTVFVLIIIAGLKTAVESRISTNDRKYFEVSFYREPTCRNVLALANYLLHATDPEDFYIAASEAMKNKCFLLGDTSLFLTGQIYSFKVFMEKNLSDTEKLQLVSHFETVSPAVKYLIVLTKLRLGREEEALEDFSHLKSRFINLLPILRTMHSRYCTSSKGCELVKL